MQAPPAPTSGDKVEWADLNGRLLYITVLDLKRDIETVHGKSDAVSANVVILDGDRKGEELADILVFPRVLRSQLAQLVGKDDNVALGRLGKGNASPGKSAPWILQAATADDHEIGLRWEQHAAAQAAKTDVGF